MRARARASELVPESDKARIGGLHAAGVRLSDDDEDRQQAACHRSFNDNYEQCVN